MEKQNKKKDKNNICVYVFYQIGREESNFDFKLMAHIGKFHVVV